MIITTIHDALEASSTDQGWCAEPNLSLNYNKSIYEA